MNNQGVPYFPLNTVLDDKFELIEAEFGLVGFGVVVRLFQTIYGREGYYLDWTPDAALLFARRVGESCEVVKRIVQAAIDRGIFDKNLFSKYGILTSHGIQERYFEIVHRRRIVKVKADYLLVDIRDMRNVDISDGFYSSNVVDEADVSNNQLFADIFEENADKNEQRKVKESKGKEKRESSERKTAKSKPASAKPKGAVKPPTLEEVRAYARERKSSVDPDAFFQYFEATDWIDSEGKPVLSWKGKFITWEKFEPKKRGKPPDRPQAKAPEEYRGASFFDDWGPE